IAACTIRTSLADPKANADAVLALPRTGHARGAAVAVFPALALSGYSIDDLLQQGAQLDAVAAAVSTLVQESRSLLPMLLGGAPVRFGNRIYNAALAVHRGRLLGVVPKVHLPNYREFYEPRQFASGLGTEGGTIRIGGHEAPFGPDLIFETEDVAGLAVHAEI